MSLMWLQETPAQLHCLLDWCAHYRMCLAELLGGMDQEGEEKSEEWEENVFE